MCSGAGTNRKLSTAFKMLCSVERNSQNGCSFRTVKILVKIIWKKFKGGRFPDIAQSSMVKEIETYVDLFKKNKVGDIKFG